MLTLYQSGDGWLYRLPAGLKLSATLVAAIGIFLLPASWTTVMIALSASVLLYMSAGLHDGLMGLRAYVRQVWVMRWIVALMIVSQVFVLGPEPAVANSTRVVAALTLSGLFTLTTRASELTSTLDRAMRPLRLVGVDSERCALMLAISLSMIPALARLAQEVRNAQRARGGRSDLRTFVLPFLVVALKHADQVGEAMTARGFR